MGLLKLIKEEIGYAIYYAIPYADLDIFGILAGTTPFKEVFSFLEHLPFVNGIDFWRLSGKQKILFIPLIAIPYVDLEALKFGRIHRWFLRSRSKKIRIATKEGTKQAKRIKEYVNTANAFGTSTKEIRETLEDELSDMAKSKRENLIRQAMAEAGEASSDDYSGSRGASRGRAMTDGGQPTGGNRRNPPQGGSTLRGYSDIRTNDSDSRNWKGMARKAGIAAAGIGIILLVGFIALQISGAVFGVGSGIAGAGLGFLTGILGFLASPLVIGLIVFIVLTAAVFKAAGPSAGGKFLVGVPIALLVVGGIVSFAIGGNPLNYLGYGGQVADSQAGLLYGEVESAARVYGQAKARVFCLLKGPACLRQWRLNNTQRPGSEDVGERYGLNIDRFQVGQGDQLDIAYKDSDYAIPVSFTLSNPRNGLKGINAEDVSYRIRIIDSERGRDNPYCNTGWKGVQEAYDTDDDEVDNDIYPGTAASTGYLTIEDPDNGDPLTLESCEMLQPALGQDRVALLNVKYDYFSQASLDFEAMSRDYFQSNEDVEKSIKNSKTADTPVKAAINVNSPVIFEQDGESSQPFAVKATLNTEETDIRYRVNEFSIQNSEYVEDADGGNCKFENPSPGAEMGLKDTARENIIYDPDRRSDSYYWFDAQKSPPIFGCVMKLDDRDLRDISPSGETLTMRVATSYTVSKKDSLGSFRIYNSICSRVNCPLIVTTEANANEEYDFITTCEGLDAGSGCSIVEPSTSGWEKLGGENPILNRKPVGESDQGQGSDTHIDQGEVAVEVEFGGSDENDLPAGTYYGGLDKREFENLASSINDRAFGESEEAWSGESVGILHYTDNEGNQEMEIVELQETESGCGYETSYPESGLIWKKCDFGVGFGSEDGDRVGFLDVMKSFGPILVGPLS